MANFTPQEIEAMLQEFFDTVGKRQYVGARYVPIFGRRGSTTCEWDNSDAYEPLTIVIYQGNSYTSKQYVPNGIDISDTNYWVQTGNWNAQIEQYRQEVLQFQDEIDTKIPWPIAPESKYGSEGQVLGTLLDGNTKWIDPVVVTSEIAEPLIDDWLDAHPEATTTVEDGSITTAKLHANAVTKPKMDYQGIPLETEAIRNGISLLTSFILSESVELDFIQGGYYSDLVWRDVATQITTKPFILPTGTKIRLEIAPNSYGITTLSLNEYEETASMSGVYSRISQTTLPNVENKEFDSNKLYTINLSRSGGIEPSYVSVTCYVLNEFDEIKNEFDTITNDYFYKRRIEANTTDVNQMLYTGTYSVDKTYTNVPEDMVSNGTLMCFYYSYTRKTQIISVGGAQPQLFFRVWDLNSENENFSPWYKIYPITNPYEKPKVHLYYSSTNIWKIDIGKVTLDLKYVLDATTDSDLWNIIQVVKNGTTPTQLDHGDILGPIKVSGASDYTFGYHGSATTTKMYIYADGSEVTLDINTDLTCDCLQIGLHDEGRNPDTLEHVMDRTVIVKFTPNNMHVYNTFKNVSGAALQIANACNGGLLACYKSQLIGIMFNTDIYNEPLSTSTSKSKAIVSCSFITNGLTMTARNIIGHDLSTYYGQVFSYVETNPRNKVYFMTMENESLADGDSVLGEFEYIFD